MLKNNILLVLSLSNPILSIPVIDQCMITPKPSRLTTQKKIERIERQKEEFRDTVETIQQMVKNLPTLNLSRKITTIIQKNNKI